jgi:hypothetical protein
MWYITVSNTLEQHVFLRDTYVKYGHARKCHQKFCDERVPSKQTIHNLMTKHKLTGLLTAKKQKYKCQVFTEKLEDIGARLKHTPGKSLKCLAQETGVSNSTARMATQLLKLRPYKTTVIHALQPCDPASRLHFCSWFLQSAVDGEIDLQLTFFSHEARFHLQGYINMQNNCYWSSQDLHLTHEVPLHPVKASVWCAVSARRIVGPVFF